jgi:hypothetical protein
MSAKTIPQAHHDFICSNRCMQWIEGVARYIIRACFSQELMIYIPAEDSMDGPVGRFTDPKIVLPDV